MTEQPEQSVPESTQEPSSAVATAEPKAQNEPVSEPGPGTRTALPVAVNQFTRRSGDDALQGSWVDVIDGPHQGRYGAYLADVSHDPESGYPDVVHVRTRDANNEVIEVKYAHVRPSERTGGR